MTASLLRLLTAFCLAALLPATVPAAEIQFRATASCSQPIVRLGDVAVISGEDPHHAVRLSEIELFPAPPRGQQRFLRLRELQDLLVARGVKVETHRFTGAAQVAIRIATETASAQGPSAGSPSTRPSSPPRPAGRPLDDVRTPVVVAARALPRGTVLRAEDLKLTPGPAGIDAADVHTVVAEAAGQETLQPIGEGRVVTKAALRPPVLVRRGDLVTVFAKAAGLRVRTLARARDDGLAGEPVALEALGDRRPFFATVVGPREAEVAPGQQPQERDARTDRTYRR